MQRMSDYKGKYLDITGKIINAAIEVHKVLGAGYQEIIYHKAMILALSERGLSCESEKEFYIFHVDQRLRLYKMNLELLARKIILK